MNERVSLLRQGAFCSLSALAAHRTNHNPSCLAVTNGCLDDYPTFRKTGVRESKPHVVLQDRNINIKNRSDMLTQVYQEKQTLKQEIEPPSWAVPAKGETRLEPVCESLGRQTAVDLTTKTSYVIGRSPNCDVQLMHATSSRRHAMLFHHSNGSCYVVDCGSAHGTYVNGKRVSPPSEDGVVVPHKVRRGAIIRFGGPGAPSFVLKSFSFKLDEIQECLSDSQDTGVLVRRNTRLNALGRTAAQRVRSNLSATIAQALDICYKRSFDSVCSFTDENEPCYKRMRCSSPPLSPEQPIRLVSPDLPSIRASKPRRVTFSLEPPQAFSPINSPECFSNDEDNIDDSH
jgi:hypothetical protein